MKKHYQLALFILFGMYSNAQTPTLDWAGQIAVDNYGYSQAIATDANGNVYTVGYFDGSADFDPGSGTLNYTTTGISDVSFIQKLDATGNLVWSKFIDGDSDVQALDIALDTSGNIYVTGSFKGTPDFDPGPGTSLWLTASSGNNFYDPFILKLDANGDYLWSRLPMTSVEDIESNSIAVEANGDVYITGYYRGQASYEIGINPNFTISNGNSDVFIFKYDSFGNPTNAKMFGGSGWDFGTSISADGIT